MFSLIALACVFISAYRREGNLPHGSAVIAMIIGFGIDVLICVAVVGYWCLFNLLI